MRKIDTIDPVRQALEDKPWAIVFAGPRPVVSRFYKDDKERAVKFYEKKKGQGFHVTLVDLRTNKEEPS